MNFFKNLNKQKIARRPFMNMVYPLYLPISLSVTNSTPGWNETVQNSVLTKHKNYSIYPQNEFSFLVPGACPRPGLAWQIGTFLWSGPGIEQLIIQVGPRLVLRIGLVSCVVPLVVPSAFQLVPVLRRSSKLRNLPSTSMWKEGVNNLAKFQI